MLAYRATSCQRPFCFIQTAAKRRCSAFPALGIFESGLESVSLADGAHLG
jgi:hypothetical protein